MKFVQPIRDPEVVAEIFNFLKYTNERDHIFFGLGVYSGLRVSDLLTLRVRDVRNKTHVNITEHKTKKQKRFLIHPLIKDELERYVADMKDEAFLFPSRQKKTRSGLKRRPIDRSTAYRMLNKVAHKFDLSEIGTHTMRKTWGFKLYNDDPKNLALLMKMFNHSSQEVTLDYLGLTQDIMDKAIRRMNYG